MRREVQRRLLAGAPLAGLGFGDVDGRTDLRGFETTGAITELHGSSLQGLDLSGAFLPNLRLFHVRVADCVFDGADLGGIRMWASDITDCSFVRATLQRASFGAWYDGRGNVLTRVDLTSAKLASTGCGAAVFEDCLFDKAVLNGTNFWQSSLIRCRFSGKLRNVIFDGRDLGAPKPTNPMLDVDFSGAQIDGCDWRGIDFRRVTLPQDPDLILLTDSAFMQRVVAAVPDDGTVESGAVLALLGAFRQEMSMSPSGIHAGQPAGLQTEVRPRDAVLSRCRMVAERSLLTVRRPVMSPDRNDQHLVIG